MVSNLLVISRLMKVGRGSNLPRESVTFAERLNKDWQLAFREFRGA